MSEIQLTLATFDPSGESLCHGKPGLSGFNGLCHLCPNSFRTKKGVRCSLNDRLIKSRSKYQLPGWKALRQQILVRDQEICVIYGRNELLHIHHIDMQVRNDHPHNLVTLCDYCHARVHSMIRMDESGHELAHNLSVAASRNM